ncbi:MAG: hypothetical protein LUD79_07005 [Oscillospiraceae bacterium]|nr:hypothetical protein [Oscillospiraceae bacterium]
MKKRCTMLLAIVLSLTLAGCGSSGASESTEAAENALATESISADAEENAISSETLPAETEEPEPTELTLVIGTSGEAETVWWNQLKEDFEAAYSDIELTLTLVTRDAVDITVNELIEIGQTPDLSNASLTETNINAGVYVPAREYLSEELRGDILSGPGVRFPLTEPAGVFPCCATATACTTIPAF